PNLPFNRSELPGTDLINARCIGPQLIKNQLVRAESTNFSDRGVCGLWARVARMDLQSSLHSPQRGRLRSAPRAIPGRRASRKLGQPRRGLTGVAPGLSIPENHREQY